MKTGYVGYRFLTIFFIVLRCTFLVVYNLFQVVSSVKLIVK